MESLCQSLPVIPADLTAHKCINLRLPTRGGLYAWDFTKNGKSLSVRVQGQTIFNNTYLMLQAALDGLGLAYIPFELAEKHIAEGNLISVLEDWWPHYSGFYLYYASRRQVAPALSRVIEALRYQEP